MIITLYNFHNRSFKGNRKRPRTETSEGASEGKKEEKEEKETNGENKDENTKEIAKESDKSENAVIKPGETLPGSNSTAAAEESKGKFKYF